MDRWSWGNLHVADAPLDGSAGRDGHVQQRLARVGVAQVQGPVDARRHDRHRDLARLGLALRVLLPQRRHMGACREQEPFDPELPRLGDSPYLHALAPHPVLERHRRLEHGDVDTCGCARGRATNLRSHHRPPPPTGPRAAPPITKKPRMAPWTRSRSQPDRRVARGNGFTACNATLAALPRTWNSPALTVGARAAASTAPGKRRVGDEDRVAGLAW